MSRYTETKTGKIVTYAELRERFDKEAEEKSHDPMWFQSFLKRTCDPINILDYIYHVDKEVCEKVREAFRESFKEDILYRIIENKTNRHMFEYLDDADEPNDEDEE